MVTVDTNVLVYAADLASPFHASCRNWLERLRSSNDPWYTTWPIVYEYLRVTTHPQVLRRPWKLSQAWEFATSLFESPAFEILLPTERHASVAAQVIKESPHMSGNLLHDAHTAILMREHGIRRICTRDANFHRFSFLEVIDPLQECSKL